MPERPGLVGEADGGTLFLDEIGELPQELQAHLLRMLDRGGEYQRLGEAKMHSADVRFIGATNRAPDSLKHDLLARFPIRITIPSLGARREDIPIIARHLASRMREENPALVRLAQRTGEKPLTTAEVDVLLRREYPANVRDLETALLESFAPKAIDRPLVAPSLADSSAGDVAKTPDPSEADVREAVAKHGTGRDAARALGLASRYELYRLMRRYGMPTE
jgi:two-component system nitrogen regulation response regulator GlnG/two-component system response regulator HydG